MTATATATRLRVLTVAAAVLGIAAAVLGVVQLRAVHAEATENSWLIQHVRPGSYPVVELGTLRSDQTAEAVWVSQPGSPNAFVDLGDSAQRVTRVGQSVDALLDNRDAPALGTGVAADTVGRSFTRDYLVAALPLLITLAAALLLLSRRPRGRPWGRGR